MLQLEVTSRNPCRVPLMNFHKRNRLIRNQIRPLTSTYIQNNCEVKRIAMGRHWNTVITRIPLHAAMPKINHSRNVTQNGRLNVASRVYRLTVGVNRMMALPP